MRLHIALKQSSFALLLVITLMLGYQAYKGSQTTASGAAGATASADAAKSNRSPFAKSPPGDNQEQVYVSRLTPGIISASPEVGDVHAIATIPWSSSDVKRAYNDAESSSCQMRLANQPVQTSLTSFASGQFKGGVRVAALTIRLSVDSDAKAKLPASTKGAILSYLRDHEIAIEPTIHQDRDGRLYFGGDCRAAFYELAKPDVTTRPEPMVEEAIGRIRVLGVLGDKKVGDARTLVLAIRYAKTDDQLLSETNKSKFETELLFLHLPPNATAEAPQLSVFISSDGRENLHRLNRASEGRTIGTAILLTTIRFDSFVMMGVYPASPVVTGVQPYRSVHLPVDMLLRSTSNKADQPSASFQTMLDQFAIDDDAYSLGTASYSTYTAK